MMVKQCQGDVHAHTHRAHVPLTVQSHGNITCATKLGVQYLNLGVPIQVSMRCAWLWKMVMKGQKKPNCFQHTSFKSNK
jgi:hypothetical protein